MINYREGKQSHIAQVDALLGVHVRNGTRKPTKLRESRSTEQKLLVQVSLGFMVVSIGIILVALFVYFPRGNAARSASGESAVHPASITDSFKKVSSGALDSLDPEAASKFVKSALHNRNPALVTNYFVLGSSADTPREAIALLDQFKAEVGPPEKLDPIGGKLVSGSIAEEVVVTSEKAGEISNRIAQLIPENGKWRIDLDSYARHVSPSWEEILGRKCEAATVRVFVTPDTFYGGGKFKEDAWSSYSLISPDVDEILFAYAARNSAQEEAMERILSKEESIHKATLIVKISGTQGRIQFEVAQVLADDWLVGETRFDESF